MLGAAAVSGRRAANPKTLHWMLRRRRSGFGSQALHVLTATWSGRASRDHAVASTIFCGTFEIGSALVLVRGMRLWNDMAIIKVLSIAATIALTFSHACSVKTPSQTDKL